MLRWRWLLVSAALVAALASIHASAEPVRLTFTVLADPADPVLAGTTSTGYFVFDNSIAPLGGGTVSSPLGIPSPSIYLAWDGQTWTTANALIRIMNFTPDGTVNMWNLQSQTGGVWPGGFFAFLIEAPSEVPGTMQYSRPEAGVFTGSVVTWEVSTLPEIVGTWYTPGTGHFVLDSFGRVFEHTDNGCLPMGTVTAMGNMFNGQPPGQVVGVTASASGNAVFATLQNGDVWRLCRGDGQGQLIGNILFAPGIAAVDDAPKAGNSFALPRPNPFNPTTRIPFTMSTVGRVRIRVFDVTGRLVRTIEDAPRSTGQHTAEWDGRTDAGESAASGTYFLRVEFPGGDVAERKVTVLK